MSMKPHTAHDKPSNTHLAALPNALAITPVSVARVLGLGCRGHQPHMGRPGRVAGIRELIVPGTPYVLPYRVRGERLELIRRFPRKTELA